MKRLLVTGGAGFIGSHLTDRLLAEGFLVTVVDNLSAGREENLSHLRGERRFAFHRQDILDEDSMEDIFRGGGFDAVFHFAANSNIAAGQKDPARDFNNTFLTTHRLLRLMAEHGVRELVFPSSSAVFGRRAGKVPEDGGPFLPISRYGAAKLASEGLISSFAADSGVRAWVLRLPNVAGERATHGVIFDLIQKLRSDSRHLEVLGDGAQEKPYLYVADLIEAILHVWTHAHESLNVFNIGGESRTTVRDLVKMVCEEMRVHPTVRYTGGTAGWDGDVPSYEYNLRKLHALGWRASRSSHEAVRVSIRRSLDSRGLCAVSAGNEVQEKNR